MLNDAQKQVVDKCLFYAVQGEMKQATEAFCDELSVCQIQVPKVHFSKLVNSENHLVFFDNAVWFMGAYTWGNINRV